MVIREGWMFEINRDIDVVYPLFFDDFPFVFDSVFAFVREQIDHGVVPFRPETC